MNDKKVLNAWQQNAAPWTQVIQEQSIESRRLVTDNAIIQTVMRENPTRVLDVGCGEGWLVRALVAEGVQAQGVDGVPALVDAARSFGQGEFKLVTYEALDAGLFDDRFDVVVANFSLIGEAAVERVFQVVPSLLRAGGVFVVQTLHPLMACGELPYEDGWREGSWDGIKGAFQEAAPWFFRTTETWVSLFVRQGFCLTGVHEPLHPQRKQPASIIFSARVNA